MTWWPLTHSMFPCSTSGRTAFRVTASSWDRLVFDLELYKVFVPSTTFLLRIFLAIDLLQIVTLFPTRTTVEMGGDLNMRLQQKMVEIFGALSCSFRQMSWFTLNGQSPTYLYSLSQRYSTHEYRFRGWVFDARIQDGPTDASLSLATNGEMFPSSTTNKPVRLSPFLLLS